MPHVDQPDPVVMLAHELRMATAATRAARNRLDAALKRSSGEDQVVAALGRKADALREREDALERELCGTVSRTTDGLLTQLDLLRAFVQLGRDDDRDVALVGRVSAGLAAVAVQRADPGQGHRAARACAR